MLGLAIGSIAVPTLTHIGGTTAALTGIGGLLVLSALACAPALRSMDQGTRVPGAELSALRRSPLFRVLAAPVLEDLARGLVPRQVADGEVIVREGEPGDRFYLVEAGAFDVTDSERWIRTVRPGEGFGEIALLRDGIRIATVTAQGPGRLYSLAREPFLEAMTGSLQAHRALRELVEARLEVG
jgi:hypothetical protein